jgi:fatty-acyl-CoA synthase
MAPYIEGLVEALDVAGGRPVLRHAGREVAGAALLADVYRYARALDGLGIGRGDLVALLAPNSPDALAVRYAAHVVGAGAVYLSVPPNPERRARMIAQFEPRLVVVFPETAELLPSTVTAPVAAVGPVPGVSTRLDALAAAEPDTPLPSRARLDDLAVVISSGGTTGVPKGSRRTFAAYTTTVACPPAPERRQLANGKLAYLTQILVDQTLLGGGTVVLQEEFDPAATLATVERERITHLFLVEPQLFALMDDPRVPDHDLTWLRAVTHIGAAAAPVLRRRARERLGPVIAHTYGASEMGIVAALGPAEHDRPSRFRCAGHVVPGVDVRFRRTDGGLDPREGLIEVRSPAMAQGYRHRDAEEAERFVDGWYRTGDVGCLDAEGMLRIDGRAVDIAAAGAPPVDLQDTLCRLPAVRYAVVITDPDRGVALAAVEPWPGGSVDLADCATALSVEHGVTLPILAFAAIPRTEQGKPDRAAIGAACASAQA